LPPIVHRNWTSKTEEERRNGDLVTVVIPAFNAADTIDETLCSVRSQTHHHLEIFVVDDGSVDATAEIVRRHCAEDHRVRLIQQPNGGVAAARNRGIAEATGELVAPIDADDLWRPDKLEKQLAALRRGGEAVSLVYTWAAIIDDDSQVLAAKPGPTHDGIVFEHFFRGNFVGNGSSALMRRAAIVEAGGYDPTLRARSAQGLEDYQLYFRIATRHRFSVVREHLTGYRRTTNSMSADVLQMLKSRDLVADEMCHAYPERASEIKGHRLFFLSYLYGRALSNRDSRDLLRMAILLLRESLLGGANYVFALTTQAVVRVMMRRLRRWTGGDAGGSLQAGVPRFLVGAPRDRDDSTNDRGSVLPTLPGGTRSRGASGDGSLS
jgi:glycosyltransferase involved in cell wall biosynthesis